jgi:hypothetical protein
MIRAGHEDVKFFTGTEVELTPAVGLKTLFVVGVQPVQEIQDWLDDFASYEDTAKHIKHIYFGANQSFPNPEVNDFATWETWAGMILPFLEQDYFCTLDIDVKSVEGLCEGTLCEHDNFIPMISVKMPYIHLLNYNTTVKIDDKDFKATNPGVWCHSLHNLMDRRHFTDWSKYTKDNPL